MGNNEPMIYSSNKVAVLIHIALYVLLQIVLYCMGISEYFILGSVIYVLLAKLPKKIFTKNHKNGIKLYREKRYEEAVLEFEKSYEYFQKKQYIDKYRALLLLSASGLSYTEMALINIAYCSGQIGDGRRCEDTYKKVLELYPDNEIAKSALRMIVSAKNGE